MNERATSTLTLIVAALIISALLAALWVLNERGQTHQQLQQEDGAYRVIPRTVIEENPGSQYRIKVRYPEIESGNPEAVMRINQIITLSVEEKMVAFARESQEILETLPEHTKTLLQDRWGTFDMTYRMPELSPGPHVLTVVFDSSYFSLGSAHPGHVVEVMHFDTTTGAQLRLADFFTDEGRMLEVLSVYARDRLFKEFGGDVQEDVVRTGTAPTAENFRVFFFEDDGVHIIFNEYQVAAYAVGAQEVVVPYERVAPFFNENLIPDCIPVGE